MELAYILSAGIVDYVGFIVLAFLTWSRASDMKGALQWFAKKWFVLFMNSFVPQYNQVVEEAKEELFSSLEGGSLVEIGVGSGANLEYYPPNTSLIVYEPNAYFKGYLENNIKKYPNVTLQKFIVGHSENMNEIQSNSISSVVCTLVLCSVSKPQLILEEVRRILKPGGKLYIMEHVEAEKWTLLYCIQHILSTFWWIPFDGCSLVRRTWEDIAQVGFSKVELRKFYAKRTMSSLGTEVIRPHIVGIARK